MPTALRGVGIWLSAAVGFAMLCSASAVAGPTTIAGNSHNLDGVWWIDDYDPRLLPDGANSLPFTEKGLTQYRQNLSRLNSGEMQDPALAPCLPEGLPRAMISAYPLQIVQHGNFVTVLHEVNHDFWTIALNAQHPLDPDDVNPAFMGGSSVGRWEGDTLVIDSVGFKTNSFIDPTGVPHSDQLHVVLKLRKTDAGKRMEAIIIIDDPEIFASQWTARRHYELRPDVRLMEFACDEPHRYLPGVRNKAVVLKWHKK